MPIMLKKPENVAGAAWPAILIGLFVAFGGVLFGYDTGTIGGILEMQYWEKLFSKGYFDQAKGYNSYTSGEKSLMVSILSAGTFIGALLASPMGDHTGRRMGLILSTFVFMFGVVLQTAATAQPLFNAGRFFAGLGVGLVSALIPLYQSETSPKWIRGTIVGAYQLAITIGLLLAAIVNNATGKRQDTGSYRIPIAIQFAWGLILIFGMLILPETPRYLIKRGRPEDAAKSLSRLRRLDVTHPALIEELAEIEANHQYELSLGKATYLDTLRGTLGKRLATGCLLQALQQLTGINFIFYYGPNFFKSVGIAPFTTNLITNIVNVVSTFPGLYMVEKWGRRPLLLFGAIGMCVCQYVVAIVGVTAKGPSADKALIAFVCFYIFFFACSWGPVAWVVTGELFPLKVRAKSLSITTATNWLLNFAIAFSTPYIVDKGAGKAGLGVKVFFIWGSACFVCIAFVFFLIYETKGLSLEQVDELYSKVGKAWQSKGFVPTVSFQEVRDAAGLDGRGQSLADLEATAYRKRSVTHEDVPALEKM
jgi:sugar porter (SP) family MFS transporter